MRANLSSSSFLLIGVLATSLLSLGCGKDETVPLDSNPIEEDSGNGGDDDEADDADEDDTSPVDDADDSVADDTADDSASGGAGGVPGGRPGDDDAVTDDSTLPPVGTSGIGRPCSFNDDCTEGLRCMASDSEEWFGGGPAHGYCTLDCLDDAEVCLAADPGALCLQTAEDAAFCMLGCSLGNVDKCHGRGDVACDSAAIGVGFCRPICRSDEDCDGGFCDLGLGHCVAEDPAGDPIGTECDPNAEQNDCETQLCLPLTETFAVCSGFCNLSEIGCGSDTQVPENPGEPICTFGAAQGSGQNDLGLCNQRCNCDGDCLHPDGLCLILPEELRSIFGTDGICVDPDFPDDDPEFTLGNTCPDVPVSEAGAVDSGRPAPEGDAAQPPMVDQPEAGPVQADAAQPGTDAAQPSTDGGS